MQACTVGILHTPTLCHRLKLVSRTLPLRGTSLSLRHTLQHPTVQVPTLKTRTSFFKSTQGTIFFKKVTSRYFYKQFQFIFGRLSIQNRLN